MLYAGRPQQLPLGLRHLRRHREGPGLRRRRRRRRRRRGRQRRPHHHPRRLRLPRRRHHDRRRLLRQARAKAHGRGVRRPPHPGLLTGHLRLLQTTDDGAGSLTSAPPLLLCPISAPVSCHLGTGRRILFASARTGGLLEKRKKAKLARGLQRSDDKYAMTRRRRGRDFLDEEDDEKEKREAYEEEACCWSLRRFLAGSAGGTLTVRVQRWARTVERSKAAYSMFLGPLSSTEVEAQPASAERPAD
mmetsp:Transcript_1039/g.2983  ORF Transcript_1039/g.2983 Transcript_1039/m.2983 type:complete len:246 (+) Transcript_1039:1050-1787(+)